ncbi:MAG: hypothetical protein WCO82_07110 [Sphingomonadales bacterium]|jgi:hypothetical protein
MADAGQKLPWFWIEPVTQSLQAAKLAGLALAGQPAKVAGKQQMGMNDESRAMR